MNPFETLGLPSSPALTDEEVHQRFVELSAQHHPDRSDAREADRQRFAEINEAYRQLRTHGVRLKALLECQHGDAFQLKGPVPETLLSRFASVGSVIQEADAFLDRKRQATTTLAEALLTPDLLKTQNALSQANEAIHQDLDQALREMASLDLASAPLDSASTLCRTLLYLEKWQGQIQNRLHDLF